MNHSNSAILRPNASLNWWLLHFYNIIKPQLINDSIINIDSYLLTKLFTNQIYTLWGVVILMNIKHCMITNSACAILWPHASLEWWVLNDYFIITFVLINDSIINIDSYLLAKYFTELSLYFMGCGHSDEYKASYDRQQCLCHSKATCFITLVISLWLQCYYSYTD